MSHEVSTGRGQALRWKAKGRPTYGFLKPGDHAQTIDVPWFSELTMGFSQSFPIGMGLEA